jgi:DNA-binding LacI/PurR family transcriptional regulator
MSEAVIPGVAAVYVDKRGFFERALDDLRARGRRRVAIISREYPPPFRDFVRSAVASRGMEMRPYWWLPVNADTGEWATHVAHLLLAHAPHQDRPDAIIVADDLYVNDISAGIAASGAVVGRDLDVIAHCNYPHTPAKVLPIRLLGFDSERLLRTCIEHIDAVRRGESKPEVTLIPAQFEEELKPAAALQRV